MTNWNYRVMVRKEAAGDLFYGIHEVYYTPKGKPYLWTEDTVGPHGETLVELEADYAMMKEAFALPVLDYDELEAKAKKTKPKEVV